MRCKTKIQEKLQKKSHRIFCYITIYYVTVALMSLASNNLLSQKFIDLAINFSKANSSSNTPEKYPQKYQIDTQLEGPQSIYTVLLLKMLKTWSLRTQQNATNVTASNKPEPVKELVHIECVETPSQPDTVGAIQTMTIQAKVPEVEAILDDFTQYQRLFPGFDDIHVVSQDANKVVTFWEQHIPLFFVPNVKYEVVYLIDKTDKTPLNRRVYRYKLLRSSTLKYNDGIIVIERDPAHENTTLYTEYDFYMADWGILKTLAPQRIWKDSIEGLFLSDVAIRFKAEHPDWTFDRIAEEGKKALQLFPIENVLAHRIKSID